MSMDKSAPRNIIIMLKQSCKVFLPNIVDLSFQHLKLSTCAEVALVLFTVCLKHTWWPSRDTAFLAIQANLQNTHSTI